jgi:hypothetical protein
MNKLIRNLERESGIDVYGLGKDRAKWESVVERFAESIVRECADWIDRQDESRCPYGVHLLEHFGVEE